MPGTSDQQVADLGVAISDHCSKYKGLYLDKVSTACSLLLVWLPMRAVVIRYLQNNSTRFNDRLKLLLKTKARSNDDPYSLLSIHVHSIAAVGGPSVGDLACLIARRTAAMNVSSCRKKWQNILLIYSQHGIPSVGTTFRQRLQHI